MRQLVCLACIGLIHSAATLTLAQDAKPSTEGSLQVSGKSYKLSHAVAYETKESDEPVVRVIASDRPIDAAKIKAVLKENDGSDEDVSLRQPHVKVTFDKAGKLSGCSLYATGFSGSNSSKELAGELKLEDGLAAGKAKLPSQGEGDFQHGFEFQFAAGLLGSSAEQAPQAAALAKLGVSGTFKGNGKLAKLAFASAHPGEAFDDKPSLTIVMTEKDHSKDKKPAFKAGFGDYGSAIIISCHEDGSIFGCEVSHAAHSKRGFSSIGSIETVDFQIAGGQVQGQLRTDGEQEFFGDTWEVDLKFAAKYASTSKPADSQPATTDRPDKPTTPRPPTKPVEPTTPAQPATAKLNVKDLAILKGVEDVEYSALVEHINYKSATEYKKLAGEIAKQLAAQGWKTDGRDLIGVTAILKRTRGEASLTIFVRPDGTGSGVRIYTEGLEWGE